jgi:transcriptional regulator with XRE-family HTH domain
MTPSQYREILHALDLTQADAAYLCGVDPRSSKRWACGDREVPGPAIQLLFLMLAIRITPGMAKRLVKTLASLREPLGTLRAVVERYAVKG